MSVRADAHIHLFQPGYVALLPENCRRVQPDEVTLYEALAEQHNVQQALVVGYEGEAWAAGNNQHLAEIAANHVWARPVAFVHNPAQLDIAMLEQRQTAGFVGLSIYVFSEEEATAVSQVPDEVWIWLVQRRWLISVNSRGEFWAVWLSVLERHPELRVVVSHLGLPTAVKQAPSQTEARHAVEPVLALAQFPGVRVKLSGFYALTEPSYGYPHQAAWPYVEALLESFGSTRLLWGSDFSPSLEWLSFPQTFGLFVGMPFFTAADIEHVEGGNLLALLADITDNQE